ncbi:MAG: hypothetical protein JST04_03915 [Bdellovibrionales bacterium]|nr:hypothetical protein [Bdellovibrionales bacterium]
MSQDRVFIGAVLAAALWFVLNPDLKSRSVEAGTNIGTAQERPREALTLLPPPNVETSAGGSAGAMDSKSALASGASREIRENILIELRAKDGGCESTVVEAPELVGTTLEGPAWDCELAVKIRGSVVFDPQLNRYSNFKPNVLRDDPPYDRAILARWENYGTLCPNGSCGRSDLVVLGDGSVQVRGDSNLFPDEIGRLDKPDYELLGTLGKAVAIDSTPPLEKRIADPKTSERVSMHLLSRYRAYPIMDADYLHASLVYLPGTPTRVACRLVQKKTPARFCELLDEEGGPSPRPEATGKPPIVVHDPGHGTGSGGNSSDPNSPNSGNPSNPGTPANPGTPPTGSNGSGTSPNGLPTAPPGPPSGTVVYHYPDEISSHPRGLTWNNLTPATLATGYVHVSCHGKHECNAYQGDTACTSVQPMLCIRKDSSIASPALPPELQTRYSTWASAEVRLLPNVVGTSLTSREAADAKCAAGFGAGWRMAEHHDGWGWGFVARGSLAGDDHFWVAIDDQPANCWNSR